MKRSITILLVLPAAVTIASCGGDAESAMPGEETRLATLELDATAPVSFSYLSGVRELSDGSLLAADPTSQVLLRVNLEAGTTDTIGRQGAGPQEYEGPDRVLPLPGDSTLLVDLGNGRLTVIDPEGVFVDWTPMTSLNEDGDQRNLSPDFVDEAGFIYAMAPSFLESSPDTMTVHRIDRMSGEETPAAWCWRTEYVRRPRGSNRPMFVLYDAWAVGTDGRVAVVRANGYSVDWFFPDGSVVKGPTHDVERFPVGVAEKEAAVEDISATAVFTRTLVGEGGAQSSQMARGVPAGFFGGTDEFEWPETMPAFRLKGTLVSPQGEAWVERMMPAGEAGRVEIFDERGIRLGFVELPLRARVVGFTGGNDAGSMAYVARTDDVGLIWLERYRIVRAEDRR